jgi:CRP-like cAMP-binding protein
MQKGLAMRVHSQRISSISVFNCSDRDERERFLAGLAISLDTAVFPPQEVIFACGDVAELIYFIHKGIVSAGSACNVYKSGDHIGLDALLPENRRETAARALTFVLSYSLSQVALYDVLDNGDFPKTASLLRRHRAKLALKQKLRQVVALAKATGLVCPDGTTFEEGKRIFKDAAEVDRFKGTLKPGPPKEEFEARQQEVLDQIARDRAEGEKMRNKRELEFLLGREVEVATEIDASSVYAQRAMEADFAQKDGDDDGVNPQVAAVVDRIDRLEGAVLAMSSRLDAILAPLDAAVATPLLPPVAP